MRAFVLVGRDMVCVLCGYVSICVGSYIYIYIIFLSFLFPLSPWTLSLLYSPYIILSFFFTLYLFFPCTPIPFLSSFLFSILFYPILNNSRRYSFGPILIFFLKYAEYKQSKMFVSFEWKYENEIRLFNGAFPNRQYEQLFVPIHFLLITLLLTNYDNGIKMDYVI